MKEKLPRYAEEVSRYAEEPNVAYLLVGSISLG